MSQDHKPEEEREALRIVAAGGKVTSEGRVNGGLNLSRAIGDHSYKQNSSLPLQDQMITPLPDVEYALLNPATDKFLVLACDGIWNSMTSQQVIDFVGDRIDKPDAKLSGICEEVRCISILVKKEMEMDSAQFNIFCDSSSSEPASLQTRWETGLGVTI
jgi:protein phosphatase 1G